MQCETIQVSDAWYWEEVARIEALPSYQERSLARVALCDEAIRRGMHGKNKRD